MSDDSQNRCELCGEPMPPGEEMFQYHGHSGPCPKPPLQKDFSPTAMDAVRAFVDWHEMDHENTPAEEMQAAYDVAISMAKHVLAPAPHTGRRGA